MSDNQREYLLRALTFLEGRVKSSKSREKIHGCQKWLKDSGELSYKQVLMLISIANTVLADEQLNQKYRELLRVVNSIKELE
jgi:hypothetical protein